MFVCARACVLKHFRSTIFFVPQQDNKPIMSSRENDCPVNPQLTFNDSTYRQTQMPWKLKHDAPGGSSKDYSYTVLTYFCKCCVATAQL